MHPTATTPRPAARRNAPAARRPAFTLTELVVAVGAAAILTASVGVLFRSVGDLASAGVAASELDQIARVIEKQMRDDIAAFNALPSDQAFLAIRFREVGDIDRDGVASAAGERPIYLRPEDRLADIAEFPGAGDPERPYRGDGVTRGRGLTTRLDDMIFLAKGSFVSAQGAGAASSHARIYWGHGMKPLPDPLREPEIDAATGLFIPARRQYLPDGDFGMRAGDSDYPFFSASQAATGRNEYATNWSLARQALLLYGGAAISNSTRPFSSPLPESMAFAPYIRDQQADILFAQTGAWTIPDFGDAPEAVDPAFPDPRFISGGRTDIAAQNIQDVRRWFEGDPPATSGLTNTATAYSEGVLADPALAENAPLWVRDPANRLANLFSVQASIAGAFVRPLVEDRPPAIIARRDYSGESGASFREPPSAEFMDLHALVASRCSRFEIAWNDGTVALAELDVNGDGDIDYFAGDRIWFDISPILDEDGNILRRNTYADWVVWAFGNDDVRFPRLNADNPEIIKDDLLAADMIASPSLPADWILNITGVNSRLLYDPGYTGGSVLGSGNAGPEAYAIWGFRTPLANGDYGAAWPKPSLIRVRMTLHDSQLRSPEGKTYEFVFPLNNNAR